MIPIRVATTVFWNSYDPASKFSSKELQPETQIIVQASFFNLAGGFIMFPATPTLLHIFSMFFFFIESRLSSVDSEYFFHSPIILRTSCKILILFFILANDAILSEHTLKKKKPINSELAFYKYFRFTSYELNLSALPFFPYWQTLIRILSFFTSFNTISASE